MKMHVIDGDSSGIIPGNIKQWSKADWYSVKKQALDYQTACFGRSLAVRGTGKQLSPARKQPLKP